MLSGAIADRILGRAWAARTAGIVETPESGIEYPPTGTVTEGATGLIRLFGYLPQYTTERPGQTKT